MKEGFGEKLMRRVTGNTHKKGLDSNKIEETHNRTNEMRVENEPRNRVMNVNHSPRQQLQMQNCNGVGCSGNSHNPEMKVKSVMKKDSLTGEEKVTKNVRFADTAGSELVNIRTFVPSTEDLSKLESCFAMEEEVTKEQLMQDAIILSSKLFTKQPDTGWTLNFSLHYDWEVTRNMLNKNCVFLEFARIIRPGDMMYSTCPCVSTKAALCGDCVENDEVKKTLPRLLGTVRVKNVSFEKHVNLRISIDEWKSYNDIPATFSRHCPYTNTDCFDFAIYLNSMRYQSLEFAITYFTNGQQFWDNNSGKNYVIKYSKPAS